MYDGNGNAAQYVYDAAGNITQIKRFAATALSIIQFSPGAGPVGTAVTINGTGFNATPNANTVKFHGTVASVSSGTSSQLVVTVPAGATTGPISVTTGANTVTSSGNFTVGQSAGAPTISGFTPTIGTAGTAVTINGTNFDPQPIRDVVRFNATSAVATAATTTALSTSVPSGASSGKIRVATPFGAATSTADFFIPPSPYTAANVGATGRIVVDGSTLAVKITTAGKIALILFDGNSGDLLDLQLSNFVASAGSVSYTIYNPIGAVLSSGTISSSALTAFLPSLPMAGTYTVLINPGATGTASFSVAVKSVVALPIDGASVNATTATAGQGVRFKFTGAVGQNLGLGLTGLTHTPASGGGMTLQVYRPDQTLLASNGSCYTSNPGGDCSAEPGDSGAGGDLLGVSHPAGGGGGQCHADALERCHGHAGQQHAAGGEYPRAGQNARLTFSGTAGQPMGLEMTQVATVPARQAVYMYVLKPDGTTLVSTNSGTGDGAVLSATLPTTGTYTVFLDANFGATSSSTLVLNPPGELTIDGPPLNVSTLSGEPHTLTFVGAVGQNLGLGLTGLTHTPASGGGMTLQVYRPDQTLLASNGSCYTSNPGGDCQLNLGTLAQAGTYWVYLVPPAGVVASATLTLSSDVTGTLVNNTPLAVSIPRAGQNARLTFSGTAGQPMGLEMTQVATVPARQAVYMYLLKPDGTTLVSTNSGTGDGAVLSATLPTTGTYTVFLDANFGATSSSTLVLNPPGELTIDGPPLNVSTLSGEPHTLTFVGAVGQNLGLGSDRAHAHSGERWWDDAPGVQARPDVVGEQRQLLHQLPGR